ncbi:MAG: slipin family protein, partial [Candidatus Eremiobacteraeota bacterium]|nr:slipin family protein [Candidatus Eremiobacteraeota bacterium]
MTALIIVPVAVVIVLLAFFSAAIKILREYERAVIFRLGRVLPAKGPGVVILIPVVDRMVRIDLR